MTVFNFTLFLKRQSVCLGFIYYRHVMLQRYVARQTVLSYFTTMYYSARVFLTATRFIFNDVPCFHSVRSLLQITTLIKSAMSKMINALSEIKHTIQFGVTQWSTPGDTSQPPYWFYSILLFSLITRFAMNRTSCVFFRTRT